MEERFAPERLNVNGCEYIRADVALAAGRRPAVERTYSVAELAEMSGIGRGALYAAIRGGRLRAVVPNGVSRGKRVTQGEWERFVAASG